MGRNRKNKKAKHPPSKTCDESTNKSGSASGKTGRVVCITGMSKTDPSTTVRKCYRVKGHVNKEHPENSYVEVYKSTGGDGDAEDGGSDLGDSDSEELESIGKPQELIVPENAKFRELYEDAIFGPQSLFPRHTFKVACSKAFLKFGASVVQTCRQALFASNKLSECRVGWDTLNLPPKRYATQMFKARALWDFQSQDNPEPEGFTKDCGLEPTHRQNWGRCIHAEICELCMESTKNHFAQLGTTVIYEYMPFEKSPTENGEFFVTGGITETILRVSVPEVGDKRKETNETKVRFSVPDPKGTNVLKRKLRNCLAGLVLLASECNGHDVDEGEEFKYEEEGGQEDFTCSSSSDDDDNVSYHDAKPLPPGHCGIGAGAGSGACGDGHGAKAAGGGGGGHCSEPSCPMCRIFGHGSVMGKLRGIKDWSPLTIPPCERQYVLRLAKKYHIDVQQSKLLQLTISSLNIAAPGDHQLGPAGATATLPKFARIKNAKRKVLGRKDFPKFEFEEDEMEKLTQAYAHLDLLDKNKEDGIFLLALADNIGLGKVKAEMINVFEKHFGCDVRLEQFRTEVKKNINSQQKLRVAKQAPATGSGGGGSKGSSGGSKSNFPEEAEGSDNRVPGLPTQM